VQFWSTRVARKCLGSLALLTTALLSTGPAAAGQSKYRDNLQIVQELCSKVVAELLAEVSFEGMVPLAIREAGNSPGGWIVEASLEKYLTREGIALSSAVLAGGSIGAEEPGVRSVLEFEVKEIGVSYVGRYRRFYVGELLTERLARVNLKLRIVDLESGSVLWSDLGGGSFLDRVPSRELSVLESRALPATESERAGGRLSRYVEPAVATAVVSGLVYLFYTNKR